MKCRNNGLEPFVQRLTKARLSATDARQKKEYYCCFAPIAHVLPAKTRVTQQPIAKRFRKWGMRYEMS